MAFKEFMFSFLNFTCYRANAKSKIQGAGILAQGLGIWKKSRLGGGNLGGEMPWGTLSPPLTLGGQELNGALPILVAVVSSILNRTR